jgi:hypothetical protein
MPGLLPLWQNIIGQMIGGRASEAVRASQDEAWRSE